MTVDQIAHIRNTRQLAGIITTRNAMYNLVGADGTTTSARYVLKEWDDVNELCAIQHIGKMDERQPGFVTFINYGIIDEIMTLDV